MDAMALAQLKRQAEWLAQEVRHSDAICKPPNSRSKMARKKSMSCAKNLPEKNAVADSQ